MADFMSVCWFHLLTSKSCDLLQPYNSIRDAGSMTTLLGLTYISNEKVPLADLDDYVTVQVPSAGFDQHLGNYAPWFWSIDRRGAAAWISSKGNMTIGCAGSVPTNQ